MRFQVSIRLDMNFHNSGNKLSRINSFKGSLYQHANYKHNFVIILRMIMCYDNDFPNENIFLINYNTYNSYRFIVVLQY